jgi:CheY-like chemotaxis protein
VVDDDYEQCRSLRRWLAQWGYEPRIAQNALEALEICDAQMPDVAIIDVMMPGMNGWQLSKKLVSTKVPPIMILISGQFEREELHPDATVVATLPKPLDLERLRELIAGVVARRGWVTT